MMNSWNLSLWLYQGCRSSSCRIRQFWSDANSVYSEHPDAKIFFLSVCNNRRNRTVLMYLLYWIFFQGKMLMVNFIRSNLDPGCFSRVWSGYGLFAGRIRISSTLREFIYNIHILTLTGSRTLKDMQILMTINLKLI